MVENNYVKLKDSYGFSIDPEISIFPIVTFDPEKEHWDCLGTGFFIDSKGGFVTAKHVFFENGFDGKHIPTMYAIQSLPNKDKIIRSITQIGVHKTADIAYGQLGYAKNHFVWSYLLPIAPSFIIASTKLEIDDPIKTFAFPLTKSEYVNNSEQVFTFKGRWEFGKIVEHHPDGMGFLKSECYQTSMKIDSGASGGPVIRENLIVGVNSTGLDLPPGEEPISRITPIHFVNEIPINDVTGKRVLVKDLINKGTILIK